MSIFSKITILFLMSIVIMSVLSFQTNEIAQKNMQSNIKDRYIESSKELYDFLIKDDSLELSQRAKDLGYEEVDKKNIKSKEYKSIYSANISFGSIEIIEIDKMYYLVLQYLDDEIIFLDKKQNEYTLEKQVLNYFVLADILILILMFVSILNILKPLKNISKGMEVFGRGDYKYRFLLDERKNDEITKLKKQFNTMAQNIDTLITSRKQLLGDISHELRTPLAKAKLSLAMMESSKHKDILYRSIEQIDSLTNEILHLERLNSNSLKLFTENVSIDDVMLNVLSKVLVNESELNINEHINFTILADINYISIAIKNLIDNALKYKIKDVVYVDIKENMISIKNFAKPLENDFSYYTEPFTKDDMSKNGYGLGLNIVKRILDLHGFSLKYRYEKNYVVFEINFNKILSS